MGNGHVAPPPVDTPHPSGTVRTEPPDRNRVRESISRAVNALLGLRKADGHWCFELEADCTIPAEYILMLHYMADPDPELEEKISTYLRRRQNADGGWPLYHGGASDLSCTVKCYFALKLSGADVESEPMRRAREWVLQSGGAARSNVFTRITLALFEQLPWRGVPFIPVEIVLLPKWFPFHTSKVSYWSRTVMIPLFVLTTLKPSARNPRRIGIEELFTVPPDEEQDYFEMRSRLNRFFFALDTIGRRIEPLIPKGVRAEAIRRAEAWVIDRLNGTAGLGAIFPAMVNAYEMLDALGYSPDSEEMRVAREALDRLLVHRDDEAYCQPCVSPVWDTGLACLALSEAEALEVETEARIGPAVRDGMTWLAERQLVDEPGDWRRDRPVLGGGGWPFQYANDHYPDLDDTALVAYALTRNPVQGGDEAVRRATEWIVGMQSRNGGFASFDADNDKEYLNEIPFADHGALLDPATDDVTARCIMFLATLPGSDGDRERAVREGVRFLLANQEADGSWYGRWGTNHIYGTWSVLAALEAAGIPSSEPAIRRAVDWLERVQREDGGWGESNDSYYDGRPIGIGEVGTAFQTAWAILALIAAGEAGSEAVYRGIHFLIDSQREDGLWRDESFTAPGFPRVFYLKYHGYDKYFPLWALARFRSALPS